MFASVAFLGVLTLLLQTPAPAAAEPAWLKSVPADAEILVRARGLDTVKIDIAKMLDAMSPSLADQAKSVLDQLLTQLGGQYGKIATEAPLLVIVRLPKAENPLAFAFLVKSDDYAAVQRSVAGDEPPRVASKPGGYDEISGAQDRKLYTHKGVGFVAFSETESLLAAVAKPSQSLEASLTDGLRATLFSGDVSVYANLATVQKGFGDQIDAARQQILGQLDQAPLPNEAARDSMKSAYAGMFDAIKFGEGLALSFDFDAAALKVSAHATVKPDSPPAKSLAGAEATAPSLIGRLPDNGLFYTGMNASGDRILGIKKLSMTAMFRAVGKLPADFERAMDEYLKQIEGETAVMTSIAGGLQNAAIMTPKQPKQAVEAFLRAQNILAASKDLGSLSLKEFKVDPIPQSYKGFDFHRVDAAFDLEKFAASQPNIPGGADALRKMVGSDKESTWIGTDGKTLITVGGQSWEKVQPSVDTLVSGASAVGRTPGFAATRKLLPDSSAMLLLLNVQGFTKQMVEQAVATGRKAGELDLPKEAVYLGATVTGTPKGYDVKFILPSAAGAVIEKGVMSIVGGAAQ
jgi:hypothetical protein